MSTKPRFWVEEVVSDAPTDICHEGVPGGASPMIAATVFASGEPRPDCDIGELRYTAEDLERARIICAALNGPVPLHVPQRMETAPRDGTHILVQTSDFGWIEAWWDPEPLVDGKTMPGAWVSHFILTPAQHADDRLLCGATPIVWLPCPADVPTTFPGDIGKRWP